MVEQVLMEKMEKAMKFKLTTKNKSLNYNDSLYNYYIDTKGIEICLCKEDSIKKIIGQNVKENVKENLILIY